MMVTQKPRGDSHVFARQHSPSLRMNAQEHAGPLLAAALGQPGLTKAARSHKVQGAKAKVADILMGKGLMPEDAAQGKLQV